MQDKLFVENIVKNEIPKIGQNQIIMNIYIHCNKLFPQFLIRSLITECCTFNHAKLLMMIIKQTIKPPAILL